MAVLVAAGSLAGAVIMAGCTRQAETPPEPSRAHRALPTCTGVSGADAYFPSDVLVPADQSRDRRARQDRADPRSAMGEPSLFCGESGREAYRFLLFPHGKPGVVVRVNRSADKVTVTAVTLKDYPRADWVVARRVELPVTEQQWSSFAVQIREAGIRNMAGAGSETTGSDGQMWLLEGRRGTAYQAVDRWSPEGWPFSSTCLALLTHAGIDLKDVTLQ